MLLYYWSSEIVFVLPGSCFDALVSWLPSPSGCSLSLFLPNLKYIFSCKLCSSRPLFICTEHLVPIHGWYLSSLNPGSLPSTLRYWVFPAFANACSPRVASYRLTQLSGQIPEKGQIIGAHVIPISEFLTRTVETLQHCLCVVLCSKCFGSDPKKLLWSFWLSSSEIWSGSGNIIRNPEELTQQRQK